MHEPQAATPRPATGEPEDAAPDAEQDAAQNAARDEGPRPLGIGVQPTGHDPVDAGLRRLADADHLTVAGHLEVYEDVHHGLRDALAALDQPRPPYPIRS